jgi:hypothetical protein
MTPRSWFAADSPLEGEGFEPSVPRKRRRGTEADRFSRSAIGRCQLLSEQNAARGRSSRRCAPLEQTSADGSNRASILGRPGSRSTLAMSLVVTHVLSVYSSVN